MIPTKTQIPVPKNYTQLPKQVVPHITSQEMFVSGVPFIYEMMPKSIINLNVEAYTRLEAMPAPTFGIIKNTTRWFWVPFRTVFHAWDDHIARTIHFGSDNTGIPELRPNIDQKYINTILKNNATLTTGSIYDFQFGNDYYILNAKGRRFYKLIKQLGYDYVYNCGSSTVDALPFLCYAKVMYDYYYNTKYLNNSANLANIRTIFDSNNISINLSYNDLQDIMEFMTCVNFEPDYFTQAWDSPTGPNVSLQSNNVSMDDISLPNITAANKSQLNSSGNTAMLVNGSNGNTVAGLSQYMIDALRTASMYMKTEQLAGDRAIDRYLALYGKTLSSEKMDRSIYIDKQESYIRIGDVFSTASSSGADLGDYAGKGESYNNGHIHWDANGESGIIIAINTLIPVTSIWEGFDPSIRRMTALDTYNPKWDGLGVDTIVQGELQSGKSSATSSSPTQPFSAIFGYLPRYASYKIFRPKLTGVFSVPIFSNSLDAWHLFRKTPTASIGSTMDADLVHSQAFMKPRDPRDWNRIFYSNDFDGFNQIYNFEIELSGNFRNIYEDMMFDVDKLSSDLITIDTEGTIFH